MKANNKKSNKIFRIIFLFLILVLFFYNPIKVNAAGTGGGKVNIDGHGAKNAAENQRLNNGTSTGGKKLYYTSFETGYVHYGESEKFLKYRLEYEADHGTDYPKMDFLNWLKDVKKVIFDKDIYVYPDCIIFNESYNGDPYYCTGWLYLYCDSNRYLEYAENIAGIGKDFVPKYYSEDDTEGTLLITFPGTYFYYPVSNMILQEYPDVYLAQIFPSSSRLMTEEEAKETARRHITAYYERATKIHDINDFSGICGQKDLMIAPEVIPKEYAWVFMFCNSTMCELFTSGNTVGSSYPYAYPFTKSELKQKVAEAIQYSPTLVSFINYGEILSGNGTAYRGFKETTQTLGIDKIFNGKVTNVAASRVGKQKERISGWGKILNSTATLENIYENLKNTTGVGDTSSITGNAGTATGTRLVNALTAENIEQIYKDSMVTTDISAGISVSAGGKTYEIMPRYVWSASIGSLMGDTDINFGRDTCNQTYNVSSNLNNAWSAGLNTLRSNRLTKSFADQGTTAWAEINEDEKIKSTLLVLQTFPELLSAMKNSNAVIRNNLGTNDTEMLKNLNKLGAENYQKWKETLIAVGDFLYAHSLSSNIPSNGWSTTYAFLRNGGANYSVLNIGINVCQVDIVQSSVSDLVLSNSYNQLPSNYYFGSDDADITYNATARNVIDWMHNGSTSGTILKASNGLPVLTTSALGGKSSISSEITGTNQKNSTTTLDLSSQWSRYDIGCSLVMDNNISGNTTNLKKDSNNTIKVEVNPNMSAAYESSKERIYYNTFVFVGRIPESDPSISVNTSDFKVVATAKFNNYNSENFDASNPVNQAALNMIMNACKDGTAAETMNVYFSSFQTDYNVNVLFKTYKDNKSYYSMSSGLKTNVIAQPYAIQKMDKTALANYSKEDYPEFGYASYGYSGLKPTAASASFTNISGNVDMEPGDVVAFQLAYTIPNDTTLSQDIRKNSATSEYSKSLYNSGEWYQKYGSINMVDLDFQLVPAKGKEDKWNKINANSNNDWVRERLNPPLMNNIFFTHADVKIDGVTVQSYDASITTIADNITASTGRDSTRATIFNLSESDLFGGNSGGTTQYNKSNVQLNVSWRYWCRGKYATSTDRNTYNYLDYSNGFTGESSSTSNINDGTKITALTVNPGLTQSDMISNPNENKLSLKLNQNVLNSAKDKSISVSVPNNQSNQFHEDWEIVSLNIKSPDKDNAAIDLVLTSGGAVLGDMNAKRGGTTVSQQLNQNYSNCVIYAIVRRDAPSDTSWKELIKNTDSNSVREQYIPSTGALKLTLTVNGGTPYSVTPSLVTGSVPGGYTGKSVTDFRNSGDYLVYKYNIPGEIKSLKADMDFRNEDSIYYDSEDSAISNNSWSEQWESVMNPDYELSIIDGQPNVIKQSNNSCPPAENIKPYLNFTVAQLNENFNGNKAVLVHVYIAETGEVPEQIHGLQYMGGGKAFRAFGSGVTEPIECRAEFKERFVPYTQGSGANKTYTINAHINYADCKNDPTEVNYENNYKEHLYTVNLSCTTAPTDTPTPVCATGQLEHRTARTIYGLGQKYEWDVKFGWSQSSSNQTDSVNVYVAHYTDGCPSRYETETDDEGNSHSVLVEYIEHEHCPCYCSPQGYAANNGKKYWRNRDLGLGLYYEYHDLRIYVWSSAHGLRDVSSGSTVVYTGETFYFYFDAIYVSNRTDQPNAKHEPYSQPYATGNGGSGCRQPCNTLSRYPDVRNVAGPQKVKIQISGTQGYNMNRVYYSPQQILSNGAVNKHYRWKPIPDKIYVAKTNVNQKINLSIGSYDFLGHWEDTSDNPDGAGYNYPGYAWYSRESHVFCGVRNATIYIRPSKPYLGTNPGSNGNGVDGSNPGNGGTPWADGDTWVQ